MGNLADLFLNLNDKPKVCDRQPQGGSDRSDVYAIIVARKNRTVR